VKKQEVKNFHAPRPARKLRLRKPRIRGVMPLRGMPGAFCHGIVKNQQGSATEALYINARENPALPHFSRSRDLSHVKARTSEFPTIP
jgi:hypothetical protein